MKFTKFGLSHFLLWFGAAVSIAEILTGSLLAPLGFQKGFAAIITGHIIGAAILFLAGVISAKTKLTAIEATKISFGRFGSYIISSANVIQLIGWTAVMIYTGAQAFAVVTNQLYEMNAANIWSIAIGILLAIWVLLGLKNVSKINNLAVLALFVLTSLLAYTVFSSGTANYQAVSGDMSFGSGVELSVTMSLSWLPLIGDYTRHAKRPFVGTGISVLGYFIGSTFMFTIGLGAALYNGTSDISVILLSANLGVAALFIILFSTITTTFLDVYSAAISFRTISNKLSAKQVGLFICAIGTLLAVFIPITQYENFLYIIGSIFAPLFAILLTDYFILKKTYLDGKQINTKNIILWIIGIISYRMLMPYDFIFGVTAPTMIGISLVCILVNGGIKKCSSKY